MELADSVDLGIWCFARICSIGLSAILGIRMLAAGVFVQRFQVGKVEGFGKVSDFGMSELKDISYNPPGALAISLFDEGDDVVGSSEVVGVSPVGGVEGDIVFGIVADEV